MRWLIFGDLHVRESSIYSTVESDGRQTFLHDVDKTFDWLCEIILKHEVEGVITLGDLTDTTGYVSTQVLASLARGMRTLSDTLAIQNSTVKEVHLVGNHDLLGGRKQPELHNLAFLENAISEQSFVSFGPTDRIIALPYGSEEWEWDTEEVDFVVGHVEITEIESALHKKEAGLWSINNFKCRTFLGHYHTPELSINVPDNVIIAGTCLPHCFADGYHEPFVILYDSGTDHVRKVVNPHARRFMKPFGIRGATFGVDTKPQDVLRVTVPFETSNDAVNELKNRPGYIEVIRAAPDKSDVELLGTDQEDVKTFALTRLREIGGTLVDLLGLGDLLEEDDTKKIFVHFLSLRAKGFLSIGDVSLCLDTGCITEIAGANGIGKSSIPESLFWCLTGETLRGLTGDDVIGDHTDHVDVETLFRLVQSGKTREVKVRRTRKHSQLGNSVSIEVDGESVERRLKSLTDEEFLKSIFGERGKNLLQTVLLTKRRAARFSALGPTARLQVIEDAARVVSLDKVKNRLSSFATETDAAINNSLGRESSIQGIIDELSSRERMLTKELAVSHDTVTEDRIKVIRQKVGTLRQIADKVKGEIPDPKSLDLETQTAQRNEAATTMAFLTGEITSSSKDLDKIEEMVTVGSCYYCKRPVKPEDYQTQLDELQMKLEECREKKTNWAKYLSDLDTYISAKTEEHRSTSQLSTQKRNELTQLMNEVEILRAEEIRLLDGNQKTATLQGNLENILSVTKGNEKKLVGQRKETIVLQSLKGRIEILQRTLTASGIRNELIESAVQKFNCYLTEYAALVKMDMSMATKTQKKKGGFSSKINLRAKGRSLKALSDGQLDRVNLPVQLALRRLSEDESGFSANLLVLDEVIQSVDSAGVDTVGELLVMSAIPSIFLIEHNPRFSSIVDKRLTVKYEKEITSVESD